jgi:hypothetical protein
LGAAGSVVEEVLAPEVVTPEAVVTVDEVPGSVVVVGATVGAVVVVAGKVGELVVDDPGTGQGVPAPPMRCVDEAKAPKAENVESKANGSCCTPEQ